MAHLSNTGLFKMVVGVKLSRCNTAPNSRSNHHLTIPFEGGMHSFKRRGGCVYPGTEGKNQNRHWDHHN
jgi:hypothetical protein